MNAHPRWRVLAGRQALLPSLTTQGTLTPHLPPSEILEASPGLSGWGGGDFCFLKTGKASGSCAGAAPRPPAAPALLLCTGRCRTGLAPLLCRSRVLKAGTGFKAISHASLAAVCRSTAACVDLQTGQYKPQKKERPSAMPQLPDGRSSGSL